MDAGCTRCGVNVHIRMKSNTHNPLDINSPQNRQDGSHSSSSAFLTFSWRVMPESIPRVEVSSSPSTRLFYFLGTVVARAADGNHARLWIIRQHRCCFGWKLLTQVSSGWDTGRVRLHGAACRECTAESTCRWLVFRFLNLQATQKTAKKCIFMMAIGAHGRELPEALSHDELLSKTSRFFSL